MHHKRLAYLPGLDGVRALAVVGVLLYHAEAGLLPGGFLGVEVFFVLSGYLITSLLLAEWRREGRIDLQAFWLRRVRRLIPALLAVLAATLTVASLFLPNDLGQLRGDALAAVAYVANWHLIFGHTSYFEAVGRPPLLRHLWSLAVEEQFYLLWPPLLLLGLRWWRRPGPLLGLVLTAALASSLLMALLDQPDTDPSRVYYGTDTRVSGPLIGAALALVGMLRWPRQQMPPWLLDLLGLAALGALAVAGLRLSDAEPGLYRGGFLGIDLVVAALLVAVVQPRGRLGRLLGQQPLRWLGLRSYAVYLWHWPVFALTRPGLDVPLDGWPLLALRLVLTGGLAELSYRLLEMPIRSGAVARAWRTWTAARGVRRWWLGVRWAGAAATLLAGTTLVGTSVAAARPPERPAYLATNALDTWRQVAQTTPPNGDTGATEQPAAPPEATPPAAAAVAATAPTPPPPAELPTPRLADAPPAEPTSDSRGATAAQDAVNLRAGPGVTYAVVTVLDPGGPLAVLGRTSDSVWVQVQATSGDTGWVRADLLQADASLATVPVVAAPPTPTAPAAPAPASARRVSAIGDSVLLGAADALQAALGPVQVDAAIGRQVGAGIQRLRAHSAAGELGAVVVVHLGDNGTFSADQFDSLMAVLADVPRVVVVDLKVPRAWEGPNNAVVTAGVQRYPNAVLVDWHAASAGRSDLFWDDGIHLRPEGARLYASLIAAAVQAQ